MHGYRTKSSRSHLITPPLSNPSITETWQEDQSRRNPSASWETTTQIDWNHLHSGRQIERREMQRKGRGRSKRSAQLSLRREYEVVTKGWTSRRNVLFMWKNVAGGGGGGRRVRLSTPINSIKLLMIKQIENVRKELSTSLMNGTAHRIFMTYESTRLLPLFHSKLISTTGARPTSLRAGSLCSDTSGEGKKMHIKNLKK